MLKRNSVLHKVSDRYTRRMLHSPVAFVLGMTIANVLLHGGNRLRWYVPCLMLVILITAGINLTVNILKGRNGDAEV